MTKQEPPTKQERAALDARYAAALKQLRDVPPDDRGLRSLKVLAQVCGIGSEGHTRLVKSLGIDDSRWIDSHGRRFSDWLKHRQDDVRGRCARCGMSRAAGIHTCPHCGAKLSGPEAPQIVGISEESELRLEEVYAGFATTARTLTVVGGILLGLGVLLVVIAAMPH